ncbi:hypothetical protein [Pseudomonas psychrophila]|uniref:Uncharacterized protein n=1 Tax=Pseudomonas psychrophila TaxID=122355 RepID=A0A8I1FUV5_9PSED|nr:hypothetical protein [Pseudomonas psychrophila]MBJ2259163.1 hypothetical protein [Pseudomonas psychrophila]
MIQALKRSIAKKIHAVIMMAPLKREMMRLGICSLFAILLNIILFFGVEADGSIKSWAETPVKLFASTTLFVLMVKIVLPLLAWTILKAVLLSANNAFSGILGFLGNQVTGALYCSGIILASIVLKQYSITGTLDSELASLAVYVFISGFLWFFIFQCAIQKTMSPALRTPAVPRLKP